jgi:hypothetical protein
MEMQKEVVKMSEEQLRHEQINCILNAIGSIIEAGKEDSTRIDTLEQCLDDLATRVKELEK